MHVRRDLRNVTCPQERASRVQTDPERDCETTGARALEAGDLVDSERELARIHGVSLMTARHALTALEREGMVVRRRGSGTFVAPPKIHFNKLMSYTEQMSGRGLPVSSKLLSLSITHTEQEIAARLALPATGRS